MVEFDFHFYGGIVLFILLMLEVADRVVMKRDLEIARDIQSWLLPATPPQVPGLAIAFATRPGEHRRRRLLRRLCPPRHRSRRNPVPLAVADVAGKSIPAALLMATFQASLKTLSATPVLAGGTGRGHEPVCLHQQPGRTALHHRVPGGVRSGQPGTYLHQCRTQHIHSPAQCRRDGTIDGRWTATGNSGRGRL